MIIPPAKGGEYHHAREYREQPVSGKYGLARHQVAEQDRRRRREVSQRLGGGRLQLADLSAQALQLLLLRLHQPSLLLHLSLLLLDEPCAGMNSEEKQDMIFWVKDIQDELGITILLIEHDMRVVMNMTDKIYCLAHGELLAEGNPNEIQNDQRVIDAYLGAH